MLMVMMLDITYFEVWEVMFVVVEAKGVGIWGV